MIISGHDVIISGHDVIISGHDVIISGHDVTKIRQQHSNVELLLISGLPGNKHYHVIMLWLWFM